MTGTPSPARCSTWPQRCGCGWRSGSTASRWASRDDLVEGYRPLVDRLQVPGSAAALLELRMGEDGRAAIGFAVHVPHYLAQAAYPAAAVTLLESVQRATGLSLPTDALREAAH